MAMNIYDNSNVPRTSSNLFLPDGGYPTNYYVEKIEGETAITQHVTGAGNVFTFREYNYTSPVYIYRYDYSVNNYKYYEFFSEHNFTLHVYRNDVYFDSLSVSSTTTKDGTTVYRTVDAFDSESSSNLLPSFDLADIAGTLSQNRPERDSMFLILNSSIVVEPTDPYAPGGPSGPGGGGGTFTDTPDQIPFSTAPAISATDTGFCTLFATNIAGIQSVANKLWTDLFDAIKPGGSLEGTVEALKSLVTSPYDAILGCTILPFRVNTTTAKSVKLYGVLDCGVSLPVAASQWQIVNCGYLDIEGTLKSYLDYSPYTKVTSIFLPYIGTVSIDVDAIMDKRLTIQYMVDILSGQCIAQIMIDNAVQAQYQGHCAVNVPVTSIDWSTTVNAGLGLVGNVANIVGSAAGGLAVSAAGLGAAAGAIAGQLPSMAQNVMGSKPDIKSGGGVGGAAGQMGGQKPVLIIERPRQSTPGIDTDNDGTVDLWQNHWTGYPSNIAVNLGTLEGYTEVARIFVNRTNATAEEKQEIERLLMEGVYF